jgi:2-polyprenyl-3-methyl-5-hydroxy-6-metoxy-1,4-benzoquinol methylase
MGVIDVGCGDGELSFLFERLGCQVTAVDHPRSNQNALAGVRALAEHIGSRVDIEVFNVDRWGIPERREYGLGLLLGVLYHLKKPFLVLETLATRCRYGIVVDRMVLEA